MKQLIAIAFLLVPALAVADTTTVERGTMHGLPYMKATATETGQGKVIAVDKKLRDVSILTAEHDTLIITCGPEVKNFAQIAVGDVVKAKYTETLTIHVEESGTPSITGQSSSETAQLGELPRGAANEKLQFSATITAIDKQKGTATLKGYRGNEYEVTPLMPENLDKVKVGQLVVFTYEEVAAVSLEKVKPAKKKK